MTANGLTFEVLVWGAPAAPLALCLHGFPDTPWTWRELGPHLVAQGWRVAAPFLRGYAPTELAPDDDYSAPALARDAVALHAALEGDDRAVVIGHDWGATAVYDVTRTAPTTFARYVAISVPPPAALLTLFRDRRTARIGLRQLRRSWYMAFNQVPVISERSLDRLIPRLWRSWSPDHPGRGDAESALTALHRPANRRAALRYYRTSLRPSVIRDSAAAPGAPVLYVHGADDGCLDADLLALSEPVLAPGSRTLLVTCGGHFPQLEQPARVNAAIAEWISRP